MAKLLLPKEALQRIKMGDSFAEHDVALKDPAVFVITPASRSAIDEDNRKCFYIGRRGSGKTAIALHIQKTFKRSISVTPQIFDVINLPLDHQTFADTRQRPFKSLVCGFERALLHQLIRTWLSKRLFSWDQAGEAIRADRNLIENCDFDTGTISVVNEIFDAYKLDNPKLWLRQIKRSESLIQEVNELSINNNYRYFLTIDRLDEAWTGSDVSIISLMALMHAFTRLMSETDSLRPFLFIRENIYERIRAQDNEFSRLETSIVFLDWSEEKLLELIERRCVVPFNTKPKIGGEAWSYFFDENESYSSKRDFLRIVQHRPRDMIMLATYCIDQAINRNHTLVTQEDICFAEERYSTSRLKDLSDEFAENYPNIRIVLSLFYGLSTEYTFKAVEDFIQKLLVTKEIATYCSSWLYERTTIHRFVELLYSIGFFGVKYGSKICFRDSLISGANQPVIDSQSTFQIHPAYHRALNLNNCVLTELSESLVLRDAGIVQSELPSGINLSDYMTELEHILKELQMLPDGVTGASQFEEIVCNIVKLCFFRSLGNVEIRTRTIDGCTIRDIVSSNFSKDGFWNVIREKYGATQITWECKNYKALKADDFQQVAYYMGDSAGRFIIVAYRGEEVSEQYYQHISRIAKNNQGGLVLPIRQKDLEVFLRQAIKGTPKETHITEIFDKTIRKIM